MLKTVTVSAFAAAAAMSALSAQAAGHRVAERIFYLDLDLSTPAGASAVLKRVIQAADELCAPSHSPVIVRPASGPEAARCRAEAMDRAVTRLHAPLVTAEYDRLRLKDRRMAAAN